MRKVPTALSLVTLPFCLAAVVLGSSVYAAGTTPAAAATAAPAAAASSPSAAKTPAVSRDPKGGAAGEFKPLKKGEWKIEVTESSLAPLTAGIKPQTICVDQKASLTSWEQRMKDEIAKTEMQCDIKKLDQDTTHISYQVACKGTPASAAHKIPAGATIEGVFNVIRESDTAYVIDQYTSAQGLLSADDPALAKIPAAQRAALAGILAAQKGGIKIKMKQRYSFIKDVCSKSEKPAKAKS